MKAQRLALQREQLDRQLRQFRKLGSIKPPQGWIRAVRDAFRMNGRQLADRMGVVRSHLSQIEKGEREGTTSIRSLQRAADALGCEFVYAFVPRDGKTFEGLVHERAEEVARRIVEEVATTMALEDQSVDREFRKREIDRFVAELVRSMPRNLWGV